MGRLLTLCAALSAGLVVAASAGAEPPSKMTIATGVDPAFSQFYVAQEAGLFKNNGLEVTITTGPSGSAMVPLLINNQIHAAYGSDLAGVINHNLDNNIVAVADGTYLIKWLSVVGRNIPDMAALKGKRVGVAKGTGGEIFWDRVVDKLKLKADDYKIVDIEAPEMVAAIERGDIDAFDLGTLADPRIAERRGAGAPAARPGDLQQHQFHLHEPHLDRGEPGSRGAFHAGSGRGQ